MAKIEELAARVFVARDAAHRAHWKTRSYAAHEALGSFYGDVIGKIDEIVEVYQGAYGLISATTRPSVSPSDMVEFLRAEADWIEDNRNKICDCDAVLNLVDELVALYRKTIYKLNFLK